MVMLATIGQSQRFMPPLPAARMPPRMPPSVSPTMPTVPCTKPISAVVSAKPPPSTLSSRKRGVILVRNASGRRYSSMNAKAQPMPGLRKKLMKGLMMPPVKLPWERGHSALISVRGSDAKCQAASRRKRAAATSITVAHAAAGL